MKHALIIRHVPHEGVAGYRQPIEAAGYEIDRTDVADPAFASLDLRAPDLLIMMGGPMGPYEQAAIPGSPTSLSASRSASKPIVRHWASASAPR